MDQEELNIASVLLYFADMVQNDHMEYEYAVHLLNEDGFTEQDLIEAISAYEADQYVD